MKLTDVLFMPILVLSLCACTAIATPVSLLSSTSTAKVALTETSTPTENLIVTNTPKPTSTTVSMTATPAMVQVDGKLFFDLNANGLRDSATFYFPSKPDAVSEAVKHFFSRIIAKPREVITVDEPWLEGFGVCGKGICTTTDNEGKYHITIPMEIGQSVLLTFVDPNAGNNALAMRYTSKFIEAITIPAYKEDTIEVPEQHLNNTQSIKISDGFLQTLGQNAEIGLMQGNGTLHFTCKQNAAVPYFWGFDLDKTKSKVKNYLGEQRIANPEVDTSGTEDNHDGTDWGTHNQSTNGRVFVLANDSGRVDFRGISKTTKYGGILNIRIYYDAGDFTSFGHLFKFLVRPNQTIYRGQIVGLMGHSGDYKLVHVHLNYWPLYTRNYTADPFRNIYDPESKSFWTLDNTPVCLPLPYDLK